MGKQEDKVDCGRDVKRIKIESNRQSVKSEIGE